MNISAVIHNARHSASYNNEWSHLSHAWCRWKSQVLWSCLSNVNLDSVTTGGGLRATGLKSARVNRIRCQGNCQKGGFFLMQRRRGNNWVGELVHGWQILIHVFGYCIHFVKLNNVVLSLSQIHAIFCESVSEECKYHCMWRNTLLKYSYFKMVAENDYKSKSNWETLSGKHSAIGRTPFQTYLRRLENPIFFRWYHKDSCQIKQHKYCFCTKRLR